MNRGIWFSHMQCCSKSVECSQTFLNWNWKNYVKLNVKGHKQKVTVNCIVLFVSSRFLFFSVKIGPNMENPSATSASFGSFATWKHCIRWSRGIQVFVQSDKNEVKLASGQIVTELRGECGSGQEREGENNWFRTSWELCLNLQPHALCTHLDRLHINSYKQFFNYKDIP